MMVKAEIIYFETGGAEHTDTTLMLAQRRFERGDIKTVVVASTYGDTAMKAVKTFENSGARLIVVGEILPEGKRPQADVCVQLELVGCEVIWGTHLGEMSQVAQNKAADLIANSFYRLGQGFKVACEIVMMATSQGYLSQGDAVIAIAGTHRGADTAIVASAASFTEFEKFSVREILCKPN
jgi:uncharacterized protein